MEHLETRRGLRQSHLHHRHDWPTRPVAIYTRQNRRTPQTTLCIWPTRIWHGGAGRWWCRCPVRVAGRACPHRVRKLYLPRGARHFVCRHCWQLRYSSQGEDAIDRALTKALAIRKRLGGNASLTEPFPVKPKVLWMDVFTGCGKNQKSACWNSTVCEHLRNGHSLVYQVSLAIRPK